MFEKIFGRKNFESNPYKILPESVRYALLHKNAKFGFDEINILAKSGFESQAAYLLIKAVADDPAAQRRILSQYVKLILDNNDERISVAIQFLIDENQDLLQVSQTVDAMKIAQLSRQGFDFWNKLYSASSAFLSNNVEKETFLIGHSTLVGLPSFVRDFEKNAQKLHILIPNLLNESNTMCGYSISDGNVDFIESNFVRPEAILVDDVLNTGESVNEVKQFWNSGAGSPDPTLFLIGENGKRLLDEDLDTR